MRAAALLCLLACAPAWAQAEPLELSLGATGELRGVVLPGPELRVKPLDRDAPLVARITAVDPHGDAFRYGFDVYGLAVGDYDLTALLEPSGGAAAVALPPVRVRVVDPLPAGTVEPAALADGRLPALGGYRLARLLLGSLWVAGLLGLLLYGRRRTATAEAVAAPPPTLAERLRPLVDAARGGELDHEGQARLERLLLSVWRRRLSLEGLPPAAALARIRADGEGGPLLRQLEAWLHQPPGRADAVDVDALLAPYAALPAEEPA